LTGRAGGAGGFTVCCGDACAVGCGGGGCCADGCGKDGAPAVGGDADGAIGAGGGPEAAAGACGIDRSVAGALTDGAAWLGFGAVDGWTPFVQRALQV
jgi:hypothetical protein